MTTSGFAITKVVVVGSGLRDAELGFGPGLNVIAGASNTGKTYVFQLIDFLLGAGRQPKNVPLSAGYSHAQMELRDKAGAVLSLSRSLSGGGAMAYGVPLESIEGDTPSVALGADHDRGNPSTISGRLLTLTGLLGREVRKNELGEKVSLSFRNVAALSFVDEARIITEDSPALSGQHVTATTERSTFGLFLSGVDDSAIVPQEKPEQRKLRLQAEMATYERLLDERETRLKSFGMTTDGLIDQRTRLDAAIAGASDLLATQQYELDRAATARDEAWESLQDIRARRLFLAEQLKRLRLLREHYKSDAARLESAMEAGELFERLPTGACPVCGHVPEAAETPPITDQQLRAFQTACAAELTKIRALSRDLDASVRQLESEDSGLARRAEESTGALSQFNAAIKGLLDRKVREADSQLSQLVSTRNRIVEVEFVAAEVMDLRAKREAVSQALSTKQPKTKIAKKVQATSTVEFCQVVEELLRAWKFPFDGNVSWSEDRFDLIVGKENRGDLGKGFRAVTHAAFTIGLMRYCRAQELPHPGIVMLDSPLNPFKGPDRDSAERVNDEVQEAFYSNLAKDKSGDQVIILENTEPPPSIRKSPQYVHFSGNAAAGRFGFFPLRPVAQESTAGKPSSDKPQKPSKRSK